MLHARVRIGIIKGLAKKEKSEFLMSVKMLSRAPALLPGDLMRLELAYLINKKSLQSGKIQCSFIKQRPGFKLVISKRKYSITQGKQHGEQS